MKQTSLNRPQRDMQKVVFGLLLIKEAALSAFWRLHYDIWMLPANWRPLIYAEEDYLIYMSHNDNVMRELYDTVITDIHLRHLIMPVSIFPVLKCIHIFTPDQCPNMCLVYPTWVILEIIFNIMHCIVLFQEKISMSTYSRLVMVWNISNQNGYCSSCFQGYWMSSDH